MLLLPSYFPHISFRISLSFVRLAFAAAVVGRAFNEELATTSHHTSVFYLPGCEDLDPSRAIVPRVVLRRQVSTAQSRRVSM